MITNRYEGAVNDLRHGDDIFIDDKCIGAVESIKRGSKWAVISFIQPSLKSRRLELTMPIAYQRQEKDEAELAAERRTYVVRRLTEMHTEGLKDKCAVQVKVALNRHEDLDLPIFSWSNLPDMLKAEATYRLHRRIQYTIDSYVDRGIDHDDALLAAFGDLDHYAERRRMQDPTSRSTSTMSNILEDINSYVLDQLRDDLQWRTGTELCTEVLAVVTATLKGE